ncbi:MAG: hypothetical protein LUH14_04220 [Clostridiaceae bacterium]|nr:hypothetical protein [Clostridiaceae bacterium]
MPLEKYYLVTNVYGDGQKPWYVVLEYNSSINPDSVSADDYEVENYDITNVYVNSETSLPDESTAGNYVLIEMSTDYTTANYGGSDSSAGFGNLENEDIDESNSEKSSDRPDSDNFKGSKDSEDSDASGDSKIQKSPESSETSEDSENSRRGGGSGNNRGRSMSASASLSNQMTVTFRQTGSISTEDGSLLDAWDESCSTEYANNVNQLVENFTQYTFTLSDGSTIMYSLYLPDGYEESTDYPLVLFMPDATGEGSDEYLALTESLGGVIWTTKEWQSEHECIVLVPQYESSNTKDPAYTMELVEEIASQYSVDTARKYLVGQSSGTIRSIKLFIDYPDEFAGGLLVAGQTDSAYTDSMSQLSTQNIWMICSEGDARAYPGMTEITDAVETAGTTVTTAQWSASLSDEEQETLAEKQASAGTSINWTVFDAETVMRDDVTASDATEHMNTWRVAYDLNTIREWLFEQTK